MAASVGVSVAFPLVFVVERTGALPWIGAGAVALQVLLVWPAQRVLGLDGLALSLALSTLVILAGLLHELGCLARASRGLRAPVVAVTGITVAAFLPPALVLGSLAAAAVGVVLYVVLVVVLRPQGLRASWVYLRGLR
jgi:hypothetical protein